MGSAGRTGTPGLGASAAAWKSGPQAPTSSSELLFLAIESEACGITYTAATLRHTQGSGSSWSGHGCTGDEGCFLAESGS